MLFLCVQGLEIHLISPAETLHQVTFVLDGKRGETVIVGQVLHRTGLTGLHNRSDRLPLISAVKSLTCLTGLPDRSVC